MITYPEIPLHRAGGFFFAVAQIKGNIYNPIAEIDIYLCISEFPTLRAMHTEQYSIILEEVGIRPTATRLLIYGTIAGLTDTFSLGNLEDLLPSIDKSVIFRTLTLFHEHHLIHGVDDGSGSHKYCLCHNHGHCLNEEAHCHFYCEHCQKTYCLNKDSIPPIRLPEGFVAQKVSYVVKGICSECARKSRKQ